jgi:predicted dienelactone hydrolase
MKSLKPVVSGFPIVRCLLGSLAVMLIGGTVSTASAAERVNIRVGFLEQSIDIKDLEQFAQTGRLSNSLQPYAPFLTLQVRQALSRRLELDPNVSNQVIDNLLASSSSQSLLQSLTDTIPGSTLQQLRSAFSSAVSQSNGLNVISFLKAYPAETIHINATSAIALLAQLNPSFWQTQVLSSSLARELAVPDAVLKTKFDPAGPGTERVQRQTLTLQDSQRKRTILVDLYWAQSSQSPLIVISHGLGADRTFLSYLANHLASYGFTVAALEHPRSNAAWLRGQSSFNPNAIIPASEFVDRPLDVSFLLDELAKLNEKAGPLQDKLQTKQVTIVGHSLGGTTALMLAGAGLDLKGLQQLCRDRNPLGKSPAEWLQCAAARLDPKTLTSSGSGNAGSLQFRDPRIVQAIVLNPVVGELFGSNGLKQVAIPTLMLASTEDTLTPALSEQLKPFNQLPTPKYLVTAIGGTHLSVGDPNLSQTLERSNLVNERQGQDVEPIRRLIRGVSLAFIQQLTPQAKDYAQFLTPAYAQSLSTPALPLRLSTSLPADLIQQN